MSDFFTRLAERTLGLAPTIQPMIPSLFAPEPDVPGDMPLEIAADSEAGIVTDYFSSTRVSQPFSTTAPATALRQQSVLATMGELQTTQMSDHLTIHNEASTTNTSRQQTRHGSQRGPSAAPVSSAHIQAPSFAPMNTQTLGVARRTGKIPETSAPFPANSMTDEPFTHNTLATHISRVSPTGEQQMVQAQQEMQATISHEQSVSHHTLVGIPAPNLPTREDFQRIQQAQQMQKTSPEPDIRVTIGRIEVRAVTAPPKNVRSQPQSDRPPAMSLDEYLRQQERGGRR